MKYLAPSRFLREVASHHPTLAMSELCETVLGARELTLPILVLAHHCPGIFCDVSEGVASPLGQSTAVLSNQDLHSTLSLTFAVGCLVSCESVLLSSRNFTFLADAECGEVPWDPSSLPTE